MKSQHRALPAVRSHVLLTLALTLACNIKAPEVTSSGGRGSESRGPGSTASEPAGRGGASGSSGSGGSGATGISLPDASTAAPDVPPPVPETCAETSHAPTRVPLDVFILLDGSGSMSLQIGTKTKLDIVREAINAFFADPDSAGLSLGLSIFPSVITCQANSECPQIVVPIFGGNPATLPGRCQGYDSACVPNNGQGPIRQLCGPTLGPCPANTTCTKVGRCPDPLVSGYCALGSTCPSGAACVPMVRTCASSGGADCAGPSYKKPLVAFGELPGALPQLKTALDQRTPAGGTPLGEALGGTLPFLKEHMAAHPDRRVVLVVASDGAPDPSCMGQSGIITALTEAHAATPSLSTYGIGVFGAVDFANGRMLMDQIAAAGGTAKAYVLEQNLNLAETFLKALAEIRGMALPCAFMIPTGNAGIDYDKVNLSWKTATGSETIGYVGTPDRCDPQKGGWHYDVDPKGGGKPTRVVACPATCAKLKGDDSGKVELRFGCKTRAID